MLVAFRAEDGGIPASREMVEGSSLISLAVDPKSCSSDAKWTERRAVILEQRDAELSSALASGSDFLRPYAGVELVVAGTRHRGTAGMLGGAERWLDGVEVNGTFCSWDEATRYGPPIRSRVEAPDARLSEVESQVGPPAKSPDLIARIFRITGGDPVRLKLALRGCTKPELWRLPGRGEGRRRWAV
jgi:hypothetical protein